MMTFTREGVCQTYGLDRSKVDAAIAKAAEKWGFTEEQALHTIACANDRYGVAMPTLLKVRDKTNQLVEARPTPLHLKFKRFQKKISYSVKPRQVWFTTFMGQDYYLDCVEGSGVKAIFVNLDNRVTEEVFDRVHTMNEQFSLPRLKPKEKRSTTRKLTWTNGASYDAITAKNDDGPEASKMLGRSCTVQRVHVTEAAYMRYYREFVSGLLDSKPVDGYVCFESTGNGAQGGFYEDCMEIFEKGVQVAPNVWHLGDKSLHFFAWWEHPEYRMETDPLGQFQSQMTPAMLQQLEQSEQEHLDEMRKDDISDEEVRRAMNWRRWRLLNEKGFLRDPEGAILVMDQEYPAKLRHAFAATGSAYLSISITDRRREEWKAINKESRLPLTGRVAKAGDGKYTVWPGSDEVMFWALPYDSDKERWENRYLISADVGGGNKDSDPDCIRVKDRHLNKYVATAHGQFGPVKTAEILMALGYLYHTAKLVWEVNNHGVAVSIKVWEDLYPNVYKHDEDAEHWKGLGFHTGEQSRMRALSAYKLAYEDLSRPLLDPYIEVYKEAAAFGPPSGKPRGKVEGQNGTHDDVMMSTAICEAVDATMAPARLLEEVVVHEQGTLGAMREAVTFGGGGGLRGVL